MSLEGYQYIFIKIRELKYLINLYLDLRANPSLGEEGIISVGKLLTTYPNLEKLKLDLKCTKSKDEAYVSVL